MMANDDASIGTVIILGAGASTADGAPIQADLFREYFKHCGKKGPYDSSHAWDRELATFFGQFFGIDVDNDDLDSAQFPTFEEVLGILEIADSQGESFRDLLGPHLIKDGTSQLWHIHDVLVFSIGEVLHETLNHTRSTHDKLVKSLLDKGDLERTVFVTFNYDILIDNALLDALDNGYINYGVEFVNQGQPHAEANMRGAKTTEYRSRVTRIRGRIYIYASLGRYGRRGGRDDGGIWYHRH